MTRAKSSKSLSVDQQKELKTAKSSKHSIEKGKRCLKKVAVKKVPVGLFFNHIF